MQMEYMWEVDVYTYTDFFRIPNTFRIPGALETNKGYFYFPL